MYWEIDYSNRSGGPEGLDYGQEPYGDSYDKYKVAYDAAVELRDSLYDEKGKPTGVNKAENQQTVDDAITALINARKNAWTTESQRRALRKYQSGQKYLPQLIIIADQLTEVDKSGYTEQSWNALQEALATAKTVSAKYADKEMPDIATEAHAAADELDEAYKALYDAYYINLTPVGEVEVSLIVTDPASARAGNEAGIAGYVGTVKLDSGYTVADALQKAGIDYSDNDKTVVFINGRFVGRNYTTPLGSIYDSVNGSSNPHLNIMLHNSDKVRIAWNMDPRSKQDMNLLPEGIEAGLFQCIDDLDIMDFDENENGATLVVKAGQEFTLTTKLLNAVLGSSDEWKVASGMSFFISDSAEDDNANQKELNKLMNGIDQIISGEDGKAGITLYKTGCYVITAYDLEVDTMGLQDNHKGIDTAGVYHSTNAGAIIRVKVLSADEEETAAAKADLIQELEDQAAEMPEEQFKPEDWATIQTARTEGIEGINNATDLGVARDAQQAAIKTIQQTQRAARAANEAALTAVRNALEKLPDDTSLISVSVDRLVQNLLNAYNDMTDYQKSLLTEEEIEKCEAIKARAASVDYQTPVTFRITVKNEADTKVATDNLQKMVEWLQDRNNIDFDGHGNDEYGGNGYYVQRLPGYQTVETAGGSAEAALPLKTTSVFTGLDYAAYLKVKQSEGYSFVIPGTEVTISDSTNYDKGLTFTKTDEYNYTAVGHFTVKVGDTEYELVGISYEGIDKSDVRYNSITVHDYEGDYKGVGHEFGKVQNLGFPESYAQFNMPFSDVTVTFEWEPVDLDTLKTNAKAAVNYAYNGYDKDEYFQDEKDELEGYRDQAIEDIDEAQLSTVITSTKKQAIADMKAVKTKAEIKAEAKTEIEDKFEAIDQSNMNDEEKAALAEAKEDVLKAVDDATDKKGISDAVTGAEDAFQDVVDASAARIAKEEADAQAANAVIAKIDALKEVSDLALSDKSTVEAARTAYDALTDNQKALVPAADLQKLKNSEAMIAALQGKADAETEAATAEQLKGAAEEAARIAKEKQEEAEEAARIAKEKQEEAEEAAREAAQNQENAEEAARIAAQKQAEAEEAARIAEQKQKDAEDAAKDAADKLKAAEEALKKAEEDLIKAEKNEFKALAKVTIKKAKGARKKMTVTWKKVKEAKGYEILVAKNKKGTKAAKTYTVKKNVAKKVIKKLKKGKYFVKVRAYKVIKGNTVYGKYSKVKKVKVK